MEHGYLGQHRITARETLNQVPDPTPLASPPLHPISAELDTGSMAIQAIPTNIDSILELLSKQAFKSVLNNSTFLPDKPPKGCTSDAREFLLGAKCLYVGIYTLPVRCGTVVTP